MIKQQQAFVQQNNQQQSINQAQPADAQRGQQPNPASQAPDAADKADKADQPADARVGQAAGSASARPDAQAARAAEARADAARRAAGQLTRGEAVQLLDAVAHELRPLPIRGDRHAPPTSATTKDW